MGWGCTSVHNPITLPRIGENTRGWKGTTLGEREQKAVAWWKADTYQLRINIYFKTSFLKQDRRLDFERGTWLPYCIQFLLVFFTSLSEAWSLLSWIRIFFFEEGGEGVGKAVQSFSLYPPLKKDFLIAKSTLRFPLKKDYLIARLSSFLQQRLAVKSITAFGENGHE